MYLEVFFRAANVVTLSLRQSAHACAEGVPYGGVRHSLMDFLVPVGDSCEKNASHPKLLLHSLTLKSKRMGIFLCVFVCLFLNIL